MFSLLIMALTLFLAPTNPLVFAARDQLTWGTTYDPAYVRLRYPGGDVPRTKGVCTDVIIRAYRATGKDLQVLIHRDKKANRGEYPTGMLDPNIDHRRVPNQVAFFRRHGKSLPVNSDWKPGDVIWWKLSSGLNHVGLVTDRRGASGSYMVIHNLSTPKEEDCLNSWKIHGHFRW